MTCDHERLRLLDKLARALANVSCEKPVEPTHGEFENCGEFYEECDKICAPCHARKYVERYPQPIVSKE